MLYLDFEAPHVPTIDIDLFWHQHILDTRAYAKDCQKVFGQFLHHFQFAYPLTSGGDDTIVNCPMAKSVSLFVTCVVDQLFPPVGLAIAEVLERIGYSVDFRQAQTCCGQPAFNSGHRDPARDVARHFLDTFEDAEYVVVASGSCCSMISHHYADLFGNDSKMMDRVHAMEAKTHEFSRFLLDVAQVDDDGRLEQRFHAPHVESAELVPLGNDDEGIGALDAIVG